MIMDPFAAKNEIYRTLLSFAVTTKPFLNSFIVKYSKEPYAKSS